jgi:hypothetical protein
MKTKRRTTTHETHETHEAHEMGNLDNTIKIVLSMDSNRTNRAAICALIAPQLRALDEQQKEFRMELERSIKKLSCVTTACTFANAVVALIPPSSEQSVKDRRARRVSFLKKSIESAFPMYKCENTRSQGLVPFRLSSPGEQRASDLVRLLARLDENLTVKTILDLHKDGLLSDKLENVGYVSVGADTKDIITPAANVLDVLSSFSALKDRISEGSSPIVKVVNE